MPRRIRDGSADVVTQVVQTIREQAGLNEFYRRTRLLGCRGIVTEPLNELTGIITRRRTVRL